MNVFWDWNCRLLPMMGDAVTKPQEAADALTLLRERFGIRRFCMMPSFDCQEESVGMFLLKREQARRELASLLAPDTRLFLGSASLLCQGLSQAEGLTKLCIPKTEYLPITLPYFSEESDFSMELNRLLYHTPIRVLLLSFDSYLSFYPKDTLERLFRLPNAAFQFSYRSLENASVRELLGDLAKQNKPIVFGTGLNCLEKTYYYEFDHYISLAREAFNGYTFDKLFYRNPLSR